MATDLDQEIIDGLADHNRRYKAALGELRELIDYTEHLEFEATCDELHVAMNGGE